MGDDNDERLLDDKTVGEILHSSDSDDEFELTLDSSDDSE